MTSRKINQNRKLSFENLENRTLMTANVNAALSRGSLILTGDIGNGNDRIQITPVANKSNQFTVGGIDGTTVNGNQNQTFTVTGSISVNFKGYGDELVVGVQGPQGGNNYMMLPGSLNVVLGDANVFGLYNTSVGGNLTVTGGSSDKVVTQTSGIGRANVYGGNHDCSINLGGGFNEIFMEYTTVERDLLIHDNSSYDSYFRDTIVLFGGNVGRNATIQTGNANEYLEINEYYFGKQLKIQTGGGNNEVVLGESTDNNGITPNSQYGIHADSIFADLGSGNDTLRLSKVDDVSASFNGGAGTNYLWHDAGSTNGVATGFEYIDGVFQHGYGGRNPRLALGM